VSDDPTAARANVNPGDKVAGYRLEEQIGQGGMAVVYRAYDERLDRRVALKVLAPGLAADNAFRTRFIRESRAAAAVDHPNIIPVYDAGDAGGCLFISMRYVQGGDVRSLLADGQPLPTARAWNIIGQVAAALDAAHAHHLIHRDVKPANMLLDRSAGDSPSAADAVTGRSKDHVYLSDFGISKQTVASNLTSTGQFVGTLDYIAPEQIEGHGLDGRADQYSLACAAFELLCGAPPFQRANGFALISSHLSELPPPITTLRPELSLAVDRVLSRAMSKAPGQRYETCSQFAADLGRALGLVPGPVEAGSHPPVWPGVVAQDPGTEPAEAGSGEFGRSASGPPLTPAGLATVGADAALAEDTTLDPSTMLAPAQGGSDHRAQAAPHQAPQGQQRPKGQQWPAGARTGDQPGPYGPSQTFPQPRGGGWPPDPGSRPPRRFRGLFVGIVVGAVGVAIAAAAIAIVVLNRGSSTGGSHSPTLMAKRQASAVTRLLASMVATHQMLQSAVLDIENNCRGLSPVQMSADVAATRKSAGQRKTEYGRARALDVSALPSGALAKSDLTRALYNSLQADDNYLSWAQQEQNGCFVSSGSSAYSAANTYSSRANIAKASFASEWNSQIAPALNQPSVVASSL
jgi:serine/threonine protein kinase